MGCGFHHDDFDGEGIAMLSSILSDLLNSENKLCPQAAASYYSWCSKIKGVGSLFLNSLMYCLAKRTQKNKKYIFELLLIHL
jgi:hypothetical protein